MFKLASTALIAGFVALPAFAAAVERPLDFERNGVHYVGKVVEEADGSRRITGHEVESGRDFALNVVNGRVTGRYDGQSIAYRAPASKPATAVLTAANR